MWQMDAPGDPYPAWAFSNVGLLKVSIPDALQPFLPRDHSGTVLNILRQRCEVLRRLGLQDAFTTIEPEILPERVYDAHPLWRGPRVDHPLRSRVPRFAPAADNPEVLALQRESIRKVLTLCPGIEVLSLHTNDPGSGMSWSGGPYQGPNGNSLFRSRKMHECCREFFGARQPSSPLSGERRVDLSEDSSAASLGPAVRQGVRIRLSSRPPPRRANSDPVSRC